MWPQFTLRRACMFASSDDQVITDQETPAKKTVRTCCSNSRVLGSVSCFYTYLRVSTLLLVHSVHSRQRKDALCLSARKRARGASAGASPIGARTIARALALCARASRPRASGVWRLALSLSRLELVRGPKLRLLPEDAHHPLLDLRRRPRHHGLGEERSRTLAPPRHDHQPRPRLHPQDLGQLVVVADGSGYVGLDVLAVLYEHLGVLGRLGVAKLLDERDLPTAARTHFR